ncbi:hypothetical protein EDB85DRAFT_2155619 [Lactarius pseudohatsudake]|nr:hypothetical protein EDB85DRAFT_2155619 [Lactarius pseudohatsudake]
MPRTRASNAHKHPGHIVQGQKKRRTTKEVAQDNARKKAASIAARQQAVEKRHAVLLQLKESKDTAEQCEEEVRAHTARPDIQSLSYQMPGTDGETEIDRCDDSEEPSPFTDDSDEELESAARERSRRENEDMIESDDDAPISKEYSYNKKNAERGRLIPRLGQDVDATGMRRGTPDTAPPSNKRKEPAATTPEKVGGPKRLKLKRSYAIGGLSSNWKAVTAIKRHGRSNQANTELEGNSDGLVSASGEFDHDEPEEALAQVRASKSAAPRVPGTHQPTGKVGGGSRSLSTHGSAETGIMFTRVAKISTGRTMPTAVKSGRKKTMVTDLPFPDGKIGPIWRKSFVPSLIAWAGSQPDPFGVNSKVKGEAEVVWGRVFPAAALDKEAREILMGVAENVLNNWRSDIGKAGISAITELWSQKAMDKEVSFSSPEHRAEYVTNSLTKMNFVYKDPDVPGSRGAFCSEIISKVYAKHLRRILAVDGYLTVTPMCIQVERGLTLLRDGMVDKDEEQGKPVPRGTRGNGFTDNPWGKRAREVVQSTNRLKDSHWAQIEEYAYVYLQGPGHDSDEGHGEDNVETDAVGVRANIDID